MQPFLSIGQRDSPTSFNVTEKGRKCSHFFPLDKRTVRRVFMCQEKGGRQPYIQLGKGTVRRVLMYREKGGGQPYFQLDKGTVTQVLKYLVSGNLFLRTVEGQSHTLSVVSISLLVL